MLPFRRSVPLLVAVCALVAPARASANGRFPTAQHVLVGPGPKSDTIVLRTTFGLVVSDDGGKTFRYICEEAMGYGGAAFDPAVGLDGASRMLVGLYDGAVRLSTDRCDGPRVATLASQFVSDVDTNVAGDVVAVSTATGFVDDRNYVWRSTDSGATFTRLGTGQLGVQFETLELADTNDLRLYATALQLTPRRVIVYRSDDGGATLIDLASFPAPDAIGAYVAAVDPKKPDTVYVRTIVAKVPGPGRQTVLYRTDDAGLGWKEVVRTQELMTGFAIDGDGETLWIGGVDPKDGLQRSRDRGATWKRIGDAQVQCLRWHAGVLYVCATNEVDHYALGRSCDGGDTIHPILGFNGIEGVFACPSTSIEATTCPTRLEAVRPKFPADDLPRDDRCPATTPDAGVDATPDAVTDAELDSATSDATTSDTSPDVGHDATLADGPQLDEPTASGSGCSCGSAPSVRPRIPWMLAVVLASLAIVRRRGAQRPA